MSWRVSWPFSSVRITGNPDRTQILGRRWTERRDRYVRIADNSPTIPSWYSGGAMTPSRIPFWGLDGQARRVTATLFLDLLVTR